MKWICWICGICFLFFLYGCLHKFPFVDEFQDFILPEINTSTTFVRGDSSQLGMLGDFRTDYIQTEQNFSSFHSFDFLKVNPFTSLFEQEVNRSNRILANMQPLLKYKKDEIKINKPVVWPRRTLRPIKISSEKPLLNQEKTTNW